jgi:N-acetylglucosaminyldiphosphoundecaprenol N-acetyl-beta-D-mannosaminyltransferase
VRGQELASTEELESRQVIDVRVDATSYEDAATKIERWMRRRESRYVCACNVHMVMEAHDDPDFREIVNGADLVTPDGMPLVWALRLQGVKGASRVYGPRLMLELLRMAQLHGVPVGLHGSTPEVLKKLGNRMRREYPSLEIPYAEAPSFRETVEPVEDELEKIRSSGARILFVALGCPKQERWMARHRDLVPAVMVGVGAAFDFLAGAKPQAPRLMQNAGLEWACRLATEPRRLWRRYLVHNPRFVAMVARQLHTRRRVKDEDRRSSGAPY